MLRKRRGGATETNILDSVFDSREIEMVAEGPCQRLQYVGVDAGVQTAMKPTEAVPTMVPSHKS